MDVHAHYLPKVQVPDGFKDNKENILKPFVVKGIEDLFEDGDWTEEIRETITVWIRGHWLYGI